VYPEAQLTFRLEEPVTISTAGAEQAFHAVTQGDYEQRSPQRQMRASAPPPRPYYYGYDGYGYWGDPFWSPYFYGPRFYYYSGPGFGFGGRGFGRRR
jgi:hypothetical protein